MIKNKKSITFICIAVTFAVIIVRDLIGINIPFFVFSALCAASSLVLNRNGRFIYALALLPFCRGISMIGFLSISRSYLVVIVAVWLYYILFCGIKIKSIFSILIIFALGIAALHRFAPELSEWAMNFLFERADAAETDGMGGRTEIIALYFNLLLSSLWSVLFGFSTGYTTTSGSTTAAHNGFQEILVCWGMIGFVFAVSWVILLYRQMFKMPQVQKNNRILCALPLVAFWLFISTIQLFTMFNYLFVMLISMVSITLTSEDKDKYELQTF